MKFKMLLLLSLPIVVNSFGQEYHTDKAVYLKNVDFALNIVEKQPDMIQKLASKSYVPDQKL